MCPEEILDYYGLESIEPTFPLEMGKLRTSFTTQAHRSPKLYLQTPGSEVGAPSHNEAGISTLGERDSITPKDEREHW